MNIEKKCLIGLRAEIVKSKNKHDIGINGKITDESKYTIHIGEKKIMKKNIVLKIGTQEVCGRDIIGRPEERIKKR